MGIKTMITFKLVSSYSEIILHEDCQGSIIKLRINEYISNPDLIEIKSKILSRIPENDPEKPFYGHLYSVIGFRYGDDWGELVGEVLIKTKIQKYTILYYDSCKCDIHKSNTYKLRLI